MSELTPVVVHTFFDILAWASAGIVTIAFRRWRPDAFPLTASRSSYYWPLLVIGAALGAYAIGTLNTWVSGQFMPARSIEGALLGGVIAVEVYKFANGMSGRTGARFAAPLAAGIAIGRIGCFLAGLEDFTYGTATSLPWGVDFGDGVRRHPVQLYESLAMAVFFVAYLVAFARNDRFIIANGFSLFVAYYAVQRFVWEFIKPYSTILGPFTIFHLVSLALAIYAAALLARPATPGIDTGAPQPAG